MFMPSCLKCGCGCECDVPFNTSFAVGVLFEGLFCVLVVLSFCSKGCVESVESRDVVLKKGCLVLVFEGLDVLDVLVFEDIVVYGGWRWRSLVTRDEVEL
jgi:hypothetical protein